MDAATDTKKRDTILANLAALVGDGHRSDGVRRLPEPWNVPADVPDYLVGAKFLYDLHHAGEELTNVSRTFTLRPWDGAHCATLVMEKVFGGSVARPTMGFWGPEPPQTFAVASAPGETTQVPWGDFQIAQLPGATISFGRDRHPRYGQVFQISVSCPKRLEPSVLGFFSLVEQECKISSLYRGAAFVGLADDKDTEFIDLRGFDPTKLVYAGRVYEQLDANVWTLIEDTDRCVELGQSLKRAVLVHGPYGTGKTLFTKETARRAIANGWTFIQAKPGDDLGVAMQTARLYEPAVVVFEDLDVIAKADQSDEKISSLLDAFDGLGAKDTKVITLLTTNHPEKLHKGMMRPGRLDAMVKIAALDDKGIEKLIRVTAGNRLADRVDFTSVVDSCRDYLPSFIVEMVGVATKYAIARTKGTKKEIRLDAEDLVNAAEELRDQWDRMQVAFDDVHVPTVGDKITEIVNASVEKMVPAVVQDRFLREEHQRQEA